jgi:DNA-binding NarL/FixJ family response regulator
VPGTVIRTLIVDDSPLFLERAVRWLKKEPHLEIVGQATSGEEAMAQLEALNPDLVIIDLAMTGLNGIQVAKKMKQAVNPPAIILISVHDLAALRKHWTGHVDAVIGKDRFSSASPSSTESQESAQPQSENTAPAGQDQAPPSGN